MDYFRGGTDDTTFLRMLKKYNSDNVSCCQRSKSLSLVHYAFLLTFDTPILFRHSLFDSLYCTPTNRLTLHTHTVSLFPYTHTQTRTNPVKQINKWINKQISEHANKSTLLFNSHLNEALTHTHTRIHKRQSGIKNKFWHCAFLAVVTLIPLNPLPSPIPLTLTQTDIHTRTL